MVEKLNSDQLQSKSEEIRRKVIDYHEKTKRGHVGPSLSAVEILTTLYHGIMEEEDRFILSKGHASSVLYTVLNDIGLIPNDKLYSLEEHPKINLSYGILASTGSLGHGLSIGLGMALADKRKNVYVLLGDGECDEGQVWEAIRDASDYGAKNLVAIVDCNGFQGLKETDSSNLSGKFDSFGWDSTYANGHDCKDLINKLNVKHGKPLAVLAKTIKGKGIKEIEGTLKSHYYHPK